MQTLTRNRHWAHASVGPYTIIASHITAAAAMANAVAARLE
jgi:hypothetical protein